MKQYHPVIILALGSSLLMMPACSSAPESSATPIVQSGTAELVAPASLEGALVAIPTTVDGEQQIWHVYIRGGKAYRHEGTWDEKEKFAKEPLMGAPLPKPTVPKNLPLKPNKISGNEKYAFYVDSASQAWTLAESDYEYPTIFKYAPHGKKAEIYIVFSSSRYPAVISSRGGHTVPAIFEITSRNGNVYSGRFINAHRCCPDLDGTSMYDSPLSTITIYANEAPTAQTQQNMSKEYKDAAEIAKKAREKMDAIKQDLEKQQGNPNVDEMVKQGYQELQRISNTSSQQVSDFAPASVKGKTIVIDNRSAEICYFHEKVWKPYKSEGSPIQSFTFKKGNSYKPLTGKDAPNAGYLNIVKYEKTATNKASLYHGEWEGDITYTLMFTRPNGGYVIASGNCEGEEWSTRGATFTIK